MAEKITGKQILVNGVKYNVPSNYDPAIFSNQLEIEKSAGLALEQQGKAAAEAPGILTASKATSEAQLRQDAARALAAQRGLVGGGRGLGLARDVAQSTGIAAGKMAADFDTRINESRQAAAATALDVAVGQGKLLEAAASRKAVAAAADTRAASIVEKYKGSIYTTKDDKNNMIKALEKERDSAINP
jgi:hypothetical protein